jgi:hypothetical protein
MISRRVLRAVATAVALLTATPAVSPRPRTPRYVLRSLAFPSGMALPQRQGARPMEPPLALAANGAVAALAVGFKGGYETTAKHIVVWRADGTRAVIGLPSSAAMAGAFSHFEPTMGSDFPFVDFLRVVLAADGTPFATVSSGFSGAYSGSDLGIFRWTGARWIVVRDGAPHELDGTIVRGLRGRRISGAYAINARGRILVTTADRAGYGVGVLDPIP